MRGKLAFTVLIVLVSMMVSGSEKWPRKFEQADPWRICYRCPYDTLHGGSVKILQGIAALRLPSHSLNFLVE